MRGHNLFNFPAFDAARDALTALGYSVTSPADLDRRHGFDEHNTEEVSVLSAYDGTVLQTTRVPIEPSREEFLEMLERDMRAVLHSDAVVMLPGSGGSKGARAERALAIAAGIPVHALSYAVTHAAEILQPHKESAS